MLEARLQQASVLKKTLEAIKELVSDANFDCNESGIALQAMDNSHVALVAMLLRTDGFEPYRCDRNISLGVNLNSLSKILKCAQNEDIITLKAEDTPDTLSMVFESSVNDRISEYDIKLMDIDQEHLGIPDTEYSVVVKLLSTEFQRICRDLLALGESVHIEATKEGIKFNCTGDIGNGSITLIQNQDTKIELNEPVSLTFSLKYLVNFTKATPLADSVILCMSNELPLMIRDIMRYRKIRSSPYLLAKDFLWVSSNVPSLPGKKLTILNNKPWIISPRCACWKSMEAFKRSHQRSSTISSQQSSLYEQIINKDKTYHAGQSASMNLSDQAPAVKEVFSPDVKDIPLFTESETKNIKKKSIWQKIKHEAQHYWDGTKLLGAETKISYKLVLKMAAGHELTRREHRQLQRTVKDLVRLVPFSAFVLIPFAELLLPVALKLFPNMLPSTYEADKDREKKQTKLSDTRKSVSQFLRTTLQESGLPFSTTTKQRQEFTEFFKKIRSGKELPSQVDVINVSKLFRDDVTLDNLSRPQLVAMCRYMNLSTFGTDPMLRYQIRHKMRKIKADDKAIWYEGVETLSVPELQVACANRGIRTHGVSPAKLRDELEQWLDLRLKHGVPSTLLVLSNAFMYNQDNQSDKHCNALIATLSSLPDELYHETELNVQDKEATNKQRLEVIMEQEELIASESKQNEKNACKEAVMDNESLDEEDKQINKFKN
ncbi:hypothetical protein PCANB_000176 [Pneumocystis canis]|nr:hypothetical protein PCANB_000176 [Pneumocystis canis]